MSAPRRFLQGLSLVELMVALALSTFLIAGLVYVFLGSKQAYRTSDALAHVQESGRVALELIARDLREAGFTSGRSLCGGDASLRPELVACPASGSCDLGPLFNGRLRVALDCVADVGGALDNSKPGCAQIEAITRFSGPVGNALVGSGDGNISIRTPWRQTAIEIVGHGDSSQLGSLPIQVNEDDIACPSTATQACVQADDVPPGVDPVSFVVALDEACEHGALFRVTGHTVSGATRNLLHVADAGDDPQNRTQGLGRDFSGGMLLPVPTDAGAPVTFTIGTGAVGRPSLFRTGEEIASGVEDMQVRYRLGDGTAFVDSAAVGGNWPRVVAVQVRLLIASDEDNVVTEPQARSIFYDGATDTFDDRRLRQVFTTTITLRNLLTRPQP